ncbi:MAG: hypothetical protein M4579_002260 [Chaenotheca gracillima]|nr:MAG: hypothetical protein M4579_002260 [Chaenotheca gracillima]
MSTTRRVPLSNVPNASNSPYRAVAAAGKRARPQTSAQNREMPYGQPPPAKKQMLDNGADRPRTPPRTQSQQQQSMENAEGRVFTKRAPTAQMTAFDRKLLAVRGDKPAPAPQQQQLAAPSQKTTRSTTDRASNENLETIRQWQKHYRKVFPSLVFYFESVPEDVRVKCSRQVTSLGAREEKFFSKHVTHVVTTRPVPTGPPAASTSTDTVGPSSTTTASNSQAQPQTINPSLLDRSSEAQQSAAGNLPPKGKFTLESSKQKTQGGRHEAGFAIHDDGARKTQAGTTDVLVRAKEMGMKIWALEKVQRMMTTMFDTETGYQAQHGHNTRSHVAPRQGLTRSNREADLSQLLRNERLNGPADRDPTVATKEMVHFKGPFLYIRDMDEKARPIMIREYSKVSHREDGAWPQFRSVRDGKCPFLEDTFHHSKPQEKTRTRDDQSKTDKENLGVPRTRAAKAALEAAKMQPPASTTSRRAATVEAENSGDSVGTGLTAPVSKRFEPPMVIPAKRGPTEEVLRPMQNQHIGHGGPAPRFFGGEPVASGVQQSNITSAIRSQMISSTAAAPGAKAGTSKEVFELKRKVLEKHNAPSGNGMPSSYRFDSAGSARMQPSNNAANMARPSARGREKLMQIEEDLSPSEEEEAKREKEAAARKALSRPKKVEKRDLKPGYCENCRDKFDDFDEHVLSRKHRKFAITNTNWADLDALLGELGRPLREEYQEDL